METDGGSPHIWELKGDEGMGMGVWNFEPSAPPPPTLISSLELEWGG